MTILLSLVTQEDADMRLVNTAVYNTIHRSQKEIMRAKRGTEEWEKSLSALLLANACREKATADLYLM